MKVATFYMLRVMSTMVEVIGHRDHVETYSVLKLPAKQVKALPLAPQIVCKLVPPVLGVMTMES